MRDNPFPDGTNEGIPADPDAEWDALVQEYRPSEARRAAAASFENPSILTEIEARELP